MRRRCIQLLAASLGRSCKNDTFHPERLQPCKNGLFIEGRKLSHMARSVAPLHGKFRLCIVILMPTGSKPTPDAFSDALMRVIRAKIGYQQISIAELARMTDIHRVTLSRIINGQRDAELNQIRRISIALNIPMSQLMGAADDILAGKDPFLPGLSGPAQ